MSIPNIPEIPPNPTTQQLAEIVAQGFQEIFYQLSGFINSQNIKEAGGWLVGPTELQSKDKTVGMSTKKTGADDIRFFAGDVITGSPKFKVTEAGIASMVAAFIQSSTGYPRVTFNSSSNVFSVEQSATSSINFNPTYLGTTPAINFHSGSIDGYIGYFSSLGKFVITSPNGVEVEISNGGLSGDVSLRPVNNLNVPDWSRVKNDLTSQTLQAALNAKANAFSGVSGTVYVASSSGGPTTTPITFTNGVRTS